MAKKIAETSSPETKAKKPAPKKVVKTLAKAETPPDTEAKPTKKPVAKKTPIKKVAKTIVDVPAADVATKVDVVVPQVPVTVPVAAQAKPPVGAPVKAAVAKSVTVTATVQRVVVPAASGAATSSRLVESERAVTTNIPRILTVVHTGITRTGATRTATAPTTLYDKIWKDHLVHEAADGTCLLYIDRHLVHEVTSPQAFEGLRMTGRKVRQPEKTLAVVDHNVPTTDRSLGIAEEESRIQVETLAKNAADFGIEYFHERDKRQGIVHVVGPEQGFTLPGTTIVCGDSHTSTHGAFGALAHGIGTSEVEHVLATQTLIQKKAKNMLVQVDGKLPKHSTAKDIILSIIGEIGTAGGTGSVIEFAGEAIRDLSMEGRMTVCNMTIEGGARAGLIAPDQKAYDYLKGRPRAPTGAQWDKALAYWQTLHTDPGAHFDRVVKLDAATLPPIVSWGTSPEDVMAITATVPDPALIADEGKRQSKIRALEYMGLTAGTKMTDVELDVIWIGSCTNGRIEDLRNVAKIVAGKKIAGNLAYAMIVPGSGLVKEQAEAEGLHEIFTAAGFEWREPGCSMCLGMNPDQLKPGQRCASTSNRNFEGRQGYRGRTHLVSPQMAAAAALAGRFVDIRQMK